MSNQSTTEIDDLLKREESFHDDWALSEDVETLDALALFESFTAVENQYIVSQLGDLKGKTVLDVGAGLGESSVYFATQGAKVYYNDISPQMGEFAKSLGEKYNVAFEYLIAPVEHLNIQDNFFDVIYCANLIHHVPPQDHDMWFKTMSKALKPGGVLVTIDPLRYNPAINLYRRMAMEVRTEDEMPVGFDILKHYKKYFSHVSHRQFWLTTLLLFVNYYFIRRYNPNKVRYWKQIFKEKKSKIGWWYIPLQKLDSFLLRLPILKYLAWNIVIIARK